MDGAGISVELTLIVFSIFLSGFFSASEAAFTGMGDLKVRKFMSERGRSADILNLWIRYQYKTLNTIFFGNTLANVVAAVLAGEIAAKWFDSVAAGLAIALTTALILVFGEVIPKTFVRYNATSVIIPFTHVLRVFFYLFYPISSAMAVVSGLIVKSTGGKMNWKREITEDDFEFMLDVSEKQGTLEEQKQQMLSNIFDISDIQVKEVMIPRTDMATIPQNITKETFLEFIRENDYSRIPVYTDDVDKIAGLLHLKDMIKLIDTNWNMDDLLGMIHKAIFVPETKRINDMLKEFQRTHTQMAVVVDEYGGVAGLITMENVLEEIVGDIHDEFDDDSDHDILQVCKDEYVVDARANIDDVCEYFGLVRTEDMSAYDTVGGLIYDIAGDIPSVGDEFIWRGFKIQITSMQDNKLQKINFIRC